MSEVLTKPPQVDRPGRVPPVVMLIPAYNEEQSIERTVRAAVAQDYPVRVVVLANNCTDLTAEAARAVPGVTVIELPTEPHKKAGSLNHGYFRYRQEADYFVCIDADTILPPDSVRLWVGQMEREPQSGGVSARFTMQPTPGAPAWENFLARMQKHEFAGWTDKALNRGGHTSVLAGTASIFRVAALDEIVDLRLVRNSYEYGPWFYGSLVEDYDLTYELRMAGWHCKVSYEVRAYTEAMRSLRTLWAQRMKWQAGTVEDLIRQGLTPYNYREWAAQVQALTMTFVRMLWLGTMTLFAALGILTIQWFWIFLPFFFVLADMKRSLRVPHRDNRDVLLAATFFPLELAAWFQGFLWSFAYVEVLKGKLTGQRKDRWALQAAAEGGRAGSGIRAIPVGKPVSVREEL